MALATLSPWPSSPVALAAARNRMLGRSALGLTDESRRLAQRLGSVDRSGAGRAVRAVTRRNPSRDESRHPREPVGFTSNRLRRCASESVGDISTSYAATHTSPLRHSGAMALLSTGWKVRRAGAIG